MRVGFYCYYCCNPRACFFRLLWGPVHRGQLERTCGIKMNMESEPKQVDSISTQLQPVSGTADCTRFNHLPPCAGPVVVVVVVLALEGMGEKQEETSADGAKKTGPEGSNGFCFCFACLLGRRDFGLICAERFGSARKVRARLERKFCPSHQAQRVKGGVKPREDGCVCVCVWFTPFMLLLLCLGLK